MPTWSTYRNKENVAYVTQVVDRKHIFYSLWAYLKRISTCLGTISSYEFKCKCMKQQSMCGHWKLSLCHCSKDKLNHTSNTLSRNTLSFRCLRSDQKVSIKTFLWPTSWVLRCASMAHDMNSTAHVWFFSWLNGISVTDRQLG